MIRGDLDEREQDHRARACARVEVLGEQAAFVADAGVACLVVEGLLEAGDERGDPTVLRVEAV